MGFGRGRTAPGNGVGVGAAIAGIAAAGEVGFFQIRFRANRTASAGRVLGRDLIGRNAGMDIGAFSLLRMHAGEPGGAGASMVARAIAERAAVDLGQITRTRSLSRKGSSDFMVGMNSKSAPSAVGTQSFWMMPFGHVDRSPGECRAWPGVRRVAAKAGIMESSSGSAMRGSYSAQERAAVQGLSS